LFHFSPSRSSIRPQLCVKRDLVNLSTRYTAIVRRAPLKLPRASARQTGQQRTELQIQTGRRGTSDSSISDYLVITNEMRSAY
jgi:hypothetical protein